MAVLQVFQAKLLQSLEGGAITPDTIKDLSAVTGFAVMAIMCAAQVTGRSMGFYGNSSEAPVVKPS